PQTPGGDRMRALGQRTAALAASALFLTSLAAADGATATTPLPAHVFAPYFETWTTDEITATAQASGVKYFTLAFLETTSKTSCTLTWDGTATQPVSGGRYLSDIASLRNLGGDVIPHLGGRRADQRGT